MPSAEQNLFLTRKECFGPILQQPRARPLGKGGSGGGCFPPNPRSIPAVQVFCPVQQG